jgi:cytochrome c biogenesis protein CcmG, thiol:disulfide interchange protein DsbE
MKRPVAVVSSVVLVFAVGLGFLLATSSPITSASNSKSALLGKLAPPVSGTTLDGAHWSSRSHTGKTTVLSFWSSWCGPCISEAPELSTFAWSHRKTVNLVGVVFNDYVSTATAFQSKYGSLYPSIIDANGAIANAYGVTSPPTTFVIDSRGRVAASLIGPISAKQLSSVIASIQ